MTEQIEYLLVSLAAGGYLLLWLGGILRVGAFPQWLCRHGSLVPVLLLLAALAGRWLRMDQGPFLTLYDVIVSNIFTAGLLLYLAGQVSVATRAATRVAYPLLLLLAAWALSESLDAPPLPPTFANPWLWVHVLAGKVFLATCLVAASLATLLLLARDRDGSRVLAGCAAAELDLALWRFAAVAFVFHSLMLVAGAAWASDAWGRYWDWDPLELWTFVTWLALGLVLHARVTFKRMPAWVPWAGICLVFVLAFINFLGIPFVSMGPHRGVM